MEDEGNKQETGAPGEIRTPDLLLRRQPLYPAELRARQTFSLHRSTRSGNVARESPQSVNLADCSRIASLASFAA